jgi:hypothetical protein
VSSVDEEVRGVRYRNVVGEDVTLSGRLCAEVLVANPAQKGVAVVDPIHGPGGDRLDIAANAQFSECSMQGEACLDAVPVRHLPPDSRQELHEAAVEFGAVNILRGWHVFRSSSLFVVSDRQSSAFPVWQSPGKMPV